MASTDQDPEALEASAGLNFDENPDLEVDVRRA